jgi:hypothetical protein
MWIPPHTVNRHAVCPDMREKHYDTTEIHHFTAKTPKAVYRAGNNHCVPTLAPAQDVS